MCWYINIKKKKKLIHVPKVNDAESFVQLQMNPEDLLK